MRTRNLLAALAALTLSATLVQPVMAKQKNKNKSYKQDYKHQNYQRDYKGDKHWNPGHHYGQQEYKQHKQYYKHRNW